jgi:hypothetical protein
MKTYAFRGLTLAIVVALALATMTASAAAETLKAFATRTGNESATNSHFFVDLDNSGHTSLAFSTTATNRLIKITYNAECGVLGSPQSSWVSVTILVDGVQANPASGTLFGFCTAMSTTGYQWSGETRQSLITVPNIGTHSVQVLVDLNNGATNWWLGDSSIVVEQK